MKNVVSSLPSPATFVSTRKSEGNYADDFRLPASLVPATAPRAANGTTPVAMHNVVMLRTSLFCMMSVWKLLRVTPARLTAPDCTANPST